jgi:hypothetical protein
MSKPRTIEFQCIKKPELPSLSGFQLGEKYQGRTFNGVFLISTRWGGDMPTLIVEGKDFTRYFKLMEQGVMQATA